MARAPPDDGECGNWRLGDAGQRKTMVETYIALEEEGKLTEEQRTMIIEAMFRPVTMGVVKEDETPSHPFGLISKIITKE